MHSVMSGGLLCFKGMTSLSVCAQVSPVQQMADRRARQLIPRTAAQIRSNPAKVLVVFIKSG